jgi:hypothetical protein
MIYFFQSFLCSIGFHDYRKRENGKSSERVCMRSNCQHKEKLYVIKDGKATLWNGKKIPQSHGFRKVKEVTNDTN